MRKGFTLAEVLITIGIIGVVAAMTLPALVGHYRKVEAASRIKKFYSAMQQAIVMSEAVNGDSKEWVKADVQLDSDGNIDYDAQGEVSKDFFMQYLAPYFKYTKIISGKNTVEEDGTKSGTYTAVYLADGSSVQFYNGVCMDVIFDINGDRKPNTPGIDEFVFFFCLSPEAREGHCRNNKQAFCTPSYEARTRDELKDKCKTRAYLCSSLLEHDNWEFKKDYPYKL